MKKRCSIQQGEKNNCSSEQSPKKLTVPVFGGPPTNEKLSPKKNRLFRFFWATRYWSAVEYWIEPSGAKGCEYDFCQCAWHFCPSARHFYTHCCSPPRCTNGYPVGCEYYLLLDVACVRPWWGARPEYSQGVEKVHYECGIDIESSDWG